MSCLDQLASRTGDPLAETVRVHGTAVLKEVGDELGRGDAHEDDEIADNGREERERRDLGHRPLVEPCRASQAFPFLVHPDKPGSP